MRRRRRRHELDGKIEWRGAGQTRPVDASGRLPRGEYATGRKADVDDLAEIRSIMQEQAGSGFAMRDLLKAVVRSEAFLDH